VAGCLFGPAAKGGCSRARCTAAPFTRPAPPLRRTLLQTSLTRSGPLASILPVATTSAHRIAAARCACMPGALRAPKTSDMGAPRSPFGASVLATTSSALRLRYQAFDLALSGHPWPWPPAPPGWAQARWARHARRSTRYAARVRLAHVNVLHSSPVCAWHSAHHARALRAQAPIIDRGHAHMRRGGPRSKRVSRV